MRGRWAPAVALLMAGLVSACASDQGPPRGRGHGGRGGRGEPPPSAPDEPRDTAMRVFISPAGEPFRMAPDAPGPLQQWFDQADANHDGALSAEEFQADQMRFFARLDTDGDGRIDEPEITVYEERIAPEILTANDRSDMPAGPGARSNTQGGGGGRGGGGRGGGGRGGHGGGRGGGGMTGGGGSSGAAPRGVELEGAARFGLVNEPEPVRAADADSDFVVTRKEWTQASARRFALLDLNHDGKIAYDELRLLQGGGRGGRVTPGGPSGAAAPKS